MAYVQVDVDMDEFETYELCDELESRLKKYGRKELTDLQKDTLRKELKDLSSKLNFSFEGLPINSLDDKIKIDFIASIWNKYTVWELENLLTK